MIRIHKIEVINLNKLYSCDEIAERYGVKTITVWSWIRKGYLQAIKMPKGYRISEDALQKYEERLNSGKSV